MEYRTPRHRQQQKEKKKPQTALGTVLGSDNGPRDAGASALAVSACQHLLRSLRVSSQRGQRSQDPETPADRVPSSEKD